MYLRQCNNSSLCDDLENAVFIHHVWVVSRPSVRSHLEGREKKLSFKWEILQDRKCLNNFSKICLIICSIHAPSRI